MGFCDTGTIMKFQTTLQSFLCVPSFTSRQIFVGQTILSLPWGLNLNINQRQSVFIKLSECFFLNSCKQCMTIRFDTPLAKKPPILSIFFLPNFLWSRTEHDRACTHSIISSNMQSTNLVIACSCTQNITRSPCVRKNKWKLPQCIF